MNTLKRRVMTSISTICSRMMLFHQRSGRRFGWRYLHGGKLNDWRISVDLLSIRFEGILRDMVGNYGGHVTKVGRDNSLSQVLLDSLLREPCLREIFREEDMVFFEYVFTAKGHNIRNNVAHAFYIPQDYGMVRQRSCFCVFYG